MTILKSNQLTDETGTFLLMAERPFAVQKWDWIDTMLAESRYKYGMGGIILGSSMHEAYLQIVENQLNMNQPSDGLLFFSHSLKKGNATPGTINKI